VKIVFVLSNPGAFIFYDEVARCLADQGHKVEIWHGPLNKASLSDRALRAAQIDTGTCESAELKLSMWRWLSWNIRILLDCGIYFHPRHPSPWLEKRWEQFLFPPLRILLRIGFLRAWIVGERSRKVLRRLEAIIPLDGRILKHLHSAGADVIVASPFIYAQSREVDYVKAAQRLDIPTAVVVQSWDNLTTKGTYHAIPDALFVWNQALAEEAHSIHGIPVERILVTGAPRFDAWFATCPSRTRGEFLSLVGLGPHDQYVTYLCSSNAISGDETSFVCEFADGLKSNSGTRHLKILVRPYPSNTRIWEGIARPDLVVWPKDGDIPDTIEARHNFYDTLHHGIAAFGVNTTAFLEAAVADKPCVTVFSGRYQRTQVESAHFQHLMRADFIEVTDGFDQAAALLAGIANGADRKKDQRRRFVKDFIRPGGVNMPAADLMAKAILGLAQHQTAEIIQTTILGTSS
jgi:hypothetical protein